MSATTILKLAATLPALFLQVAAAAATTVTVTAGTSDEGLVSAIEGASLSRQLEDDPEARPGDLIAAAQADYRRILTALYDEGYYGPAISILVDGREASTIPPVGGPDRIDRIDIRVAPGPEFRFGRVGLGPLPPDAELPEGFTPGEPARSRIIRRAVNTGVDAWRGDGYARADIASEDITAVHPQERLDVAVALAPGRQYRFGPLIVSGNEAVRTRRIIEIAGLPTGEIYTPEAIRTSTERLRRTGTFSSVVLRESEADGPDGTLPVTAEIAERAPRRIGFGVEVSSVDGLGVSAFWLHRNLLGGAERLRLEAEIDQIGIDGDRPDLGFTAEFTRPGTFGLDRDLYSSLEVVDVVDDLIELRAALFEIGFTQRFGENVTGTAGVGLRYAEVITELVDVDYLLATFPVSLEWDRRNDDLNPSSGFYVDVEATPFLGIDNAEDGARFFSDARVYRSFGTGDRFTFAGRLQLGSLIGPEGAEAPQDFLFYSGGGGTVRGQQFQSLGVEVDGAEIGGNSFLGAQIEARVGITDAFQGVAFYDFGMVGEETLPAEGDPSHSGAGIGVRYNTGIGPIRLDIATPTSGDDAGQRVEFYIGIGQAF